MSSLAVDPFYSSEEYLKMERKSKNKNEYINGKILAMSGASRNHNLIAGNVFREISIQLKDKPCEVYISDMRVKVSFTGLYTYPDITAVCEEIRFDDEHNDTLINPSVIIEVLSPSTEAYDRGEKFTHYRRLDSLRHYILVSQNKLLIEHYVRQNQQWTLFESDKLNDIITISTINCQLSLQEIYSKVNF